MSIRTYIFALLTSLVLVIAAVLSYQSARIFINSFDRMTERTMSTIAKQYPEQGKIEQTVLGYHVATQWQQVPQQVRDQFDKASIENNVLYSKFVDWIYIAPPKKMYALMAFEQNNKRIFVSHFNDDVQKDVDEQLKKHGHLIDPIMTIILVGLSVLVVFVLVLLHIFRKITIPVESLQDWAKGLTIDDINKKPPDFRFSEFNALATLIHNNLVSVAESVEREQAFLSYASHELRTPIAVLRSNAALLEKVNPNPSDSERKVRDRIQRASLTMKSMTETLLWLSREGDGDMPVESASLGDLVQNTQAELTYLLAGKSVDVSVSTDKSFSQMSVIPSLIVLNNLIRNAFQHTYQGHVDIIQTGNGVVITNINSNINSNINTSTNTCTSTRTHSESEHIEDSATHNELGFGLGMKLVEKLTKQFGWRYSTEKLTHGYKVSIFFS